MDAIDSSLIYHLFKCCEIFNGQDRSEEHLIFDYDKVAESNTTNQSNYIYLNDEIDDQKETEKDLGLLSKKEESLASII
ncbi:13643_t:CDS:2 [Funneliformis caledonium]|uniref:13643_t:CDS:1 n=1 Tax=Funneliformis caledonium TaxID=1117310 RepID=A0A9N9A438_9GLOM|nr:13643_t:CDS:2 [Funneliformis caledonium]